MKTLNWMSHAVNTPSMEKVSKMLAMLFRQFQNS